MFGLPLPNWEADCLFTLIAGKAELCRPSGELVTAPCRRPACSISSAASFVAAPLPDLVFKPLQGLAQRLETKRLRRDNTLRKALIVFAEYSAI